MPKELPNATHVFEILVRENASMLSAYLRSLLRSDEALDDVFQKTLIVAWRRLNDFDRSREFGPWLRGIARRLVLEHHRDRGLNVAATDPAVLDALDARFEVFAARGEQFRERADRLLGCLSRLPEAMQEIVRLVYAQRMLLRQVAEALNAAEETIKKRLQRARQALAECLRGGNEVAS